MAVVAFPWKFVEKLFQASEKMLIWCGKVNCLYCRRMIITISNHCCAFGIFKRIYKEFLSRWHGWSLKKDHLWLNALNDGMQLCDIGAPRFSMVCTDQRYELHCDKKKHKKYVNSMSIPA